MAISTKLKVPLVDLEAQYATIAPEIDGALRRVIEKGDFILGAAVREFEAAFASYCGVPHAIAVGSGTDALFLAMRALNLGPGDEVIVPAMTFVATAEPVIYCGARPVFIDVCHDDLLIDAAAVEAVITPRTRGIVPVHLYGMPADMHALHEIAQRHNLWVLEDAAQAHGAMIGSRRVGTFGALACFSFYPGKNLGAYGDGGMVVTRDAELAVRLRMLRDHGSRAKYTHAEVGYCSRLDTLQAAVLSVKLAHLDEWNASRRTAAARYDDLLGTRLERIGRAHHHESVHHIYAIRVPNGQRDRVRDQLVAAGVGASVHYPIPVHQQEAFLELGYGGMGTAKRRAGGPRTPVAAAVPRNNGGPAALRCRRVVRCARACDVTVGAWTAPCVGMVSNTYYAFDPRLRRQAGALVAHGYHVEVLCQRQPGEPAEERLGGVNVRRVGGPKYRGRSLRAYLRSNISFFIRAFIALGRKKVHQACAADQV